MLLIRNSVQTVQFTQLEMAKKATLREMLDCDPAPPLPLVECSDGIGHPVTVDPIDILDGKFLPMPPPSPPPRTQERSSDAIKLSRLETVSSRSRPVRVNFDDADAPKTKAAAVEYTEDLDALVAPPLKKKKKKKKKVSISDVKHNDANIKIYNAQSNEYLGWRKSCRSVVTLKDPSAHSSQVTAPEGHICSRVFAAYEPGS